MNRITLHAYIPGILGTFKLSTRAKHTHTRIYQHICFNNGVYNVFNIIKCCLPSVSLCRNSLTLFIYQITHTHTRRRRTVVVVRYAFFVRVRVCIRVVLVHLQFTLLWHLTVSRDSRLCEIRAEERIEYYTRFAQHAIETVALHQHIACVQLINISYNIHTYIQDTTETLHTCTRTMELVRLARHKYDGGSTRGFQRQIRRRKSALCALCCTPRNVRTLNPLLYVKTNRLRLI